jgi:hypothetical protein
MWNTPNLMTLFRMKVGDFTVALIPMYQWQSRLPNLLGTRAFPL